MFRVESNAISLGRSLGRMGDRTVRRATVFALNDTAADILKANQEGMQRRFDRPTRFTLNAFMVWRANIRDENPYAEVRERPSVGKRHFLKVQEHGGRRPQTGLEKAISAAMPSDTVKAVVPTRQAKTDKAGNWSRAQRAKAVTAIQGGGGEMFASDGSGRLSAGIFQRGKKGQSLKKLATFTTEDPDYKPLLGFFSGGEHVWEKEYARHYRRIFARLSRKGPQN